MIVYLAHKEKFREDTLSNRIEKIVHDDFLLTPPSLFVSHPHYVSTTLP
jgi:hypothetical protein